MSLDISGVKPEVAVLSALCDLELFIFSGDGACQLG